MVYNNTNTSIYRWEWFSIGLNVPINFIMLTQNNPYGKLIMKYPLIFKYPEIVRYSVPSSNEDF